MKFICITEVQYRMFSIAYWLHKICRLLTETFKIIRTVLIGINDCEMCFLNCAKFYNVMRYVDHTWLHKNIPIDYQQWAGLKTNFERFSFKFLFRCLISFHVLSQLTKNTTTPFKVFKVTISHNLNLLSYRYRFNV